jgi:TP901 family phage tail tape measure protein
MAQTYDRRINLYINGREVQNNISSIRKEMYKLTNEQARMTIGSREYYQHAAQIKRLKGIMAQHVQDIGNIKKGWSMQGVADGFNRYFAMVTAAMASFAGVAITIKSSVQAFAEFDDKLADVMKTTGLTKDQVKSLNTELEKIDTRSAQTELLDLARVAGKLGITAEDEILGFVRAADKIKVALSEDLGGDVEDSINQLGKLVDIFKLKDEFGIEDALLKIGSAINSLGAAGTANEAYMVEFSKRLAGIAPAAGISIQQVLGLGATLDELGQTSEVSGTAMVQVISNMFKDTAAYAKIAGMSVKDFTTLLETDANEAFIKLLEGARGSGTGFAEMAKNLQDLGLDGARSTAVLGVLADNLDKLREKQAFSNAEFEKGTSILNEFNTKNESAQAQLEKAKKSFTAMQVELGERLSPAYTSVIHKSSALLKILGATIEFLFKHGKQILVTVAAITAYTIAAKLATLWQERNNLATKEGIFMQKLQTFAFKAQFAAIALYNSAVALLNKNLKVAAMQWRAFLAASSANPIGLIVGAIVALGGALYLLSKRLTEAEKLQKTLNAVNLEAENQIIDQKLQMEQLLRIAQDDNRSKADRIAAIEKLNKLSPEYLKGLTLETINTDAAKTATDKYINSLREKAKVQAAQEKLVEIEKELLDLQQGELSFWDETKAAGLFYAAGLRLQTTRTEDLADLEKYRAEKAKELNLQKEKLLEITSKQFNLDKTAAGVNSAGTSGTILGEYVAPLTEKEVKELESLTDKARRALIPDEDAPIKDMWSADMERHAEALAEKKASEEEWTEFLKKQIEDRIAAEQKEFEYEQEIEEARLALKMATFDAIGEIAGMLASMAKEGSAAQIAMLAVEKSAAIASIIINTLAANQKAKLTMGPAAGSLWAITNSITAAASIAKIVGTTITGFKDKKNNDKPGYATGGYTRGERMYIAGEAGTEWIAPNNMVNSPVTGPIIAALENMRSSTLSPAALQTFASGGFNSSSASGAQIYPPFSSKEGAGGGSYADSAIIAKLDQLADTIRNMKIYTAIEDIKKGDKRYTEIQNTRGL